MSIKFLKFNIYTVILVKQLSPGSLSDLDGLSEGIEV